MKNTAERWEKSRMGAAKFRAGYDKKQQVEQLQEVQDEEQIFLDKLGEGLDRFFWYGLGPVATLYVVYLVIQAGRMWIL